MLKLRNCTRAEFVSAISDYKEDNFAKTFVAKADMQNIWEQCFGVFDSDVLGAAIITTISKTKPPVANLQLLHTFYKHRGNGYARMLCQDSLVRARELGAKYYRVSSEKESVGFYERLGFKFWGSQKSGCQLSMFKIGGNTFEEAIYDCDSIIYKAVNRKGKGGCVQLFDFAKSKLEENMSLFL